MFRKMEKGKILLGFVSAHLHHLHINMTKKKFTKEQTSEFERQLLIMGSTGI